MAVITTSIMGTQRYPSPSLGIAWGAHPRPDCGPSHSCPTTLCTYPTLESGDVFLAGIEWDRAINLTYALGPVLLANHWRLAEPMLFG